MSRWIKWNKRSKKSIADKMLVTFNALPYEDDQIVGMGWFRDKVKQKALTIWDVCPESFDSSWEITFRDGSKAILNNPHQEAFCAGFYTV